MLRAIVWITAATAVLTGCTTVNPGLTEPPAAAQFRHQLTPNPNHLENVDIHLGRRSLADQSAWSPGEDQELIGVTYDSYWRQNDVLGIGYELSGFYSYHSERVSSPSGSFRYDTGTGELAGGARITLGAGDTGIRVYFGAGPALIDAQAQGVAGHSSESDDDASLGVYVHGGAYWVFAGHFNIGLDYRVLRGTSLRVFGVDTNANYEQGSLLLGWSF